MCQSCSIEINNNEFVYVCPLIVAHNYPIYNSQRRYHTPKNNKPVNHKSTTSNEIQKSDSPRMDGFLLSKDHRDLCVSD